jgi:GDPmannose 4,6-dehydratase
MLAAARDASCGAGAKVPRGSQDCLRVHDMATKRALIIGIAGQDGSYLGELLLEQGYDVSGAVRQPVSTAFENLAPIRGAIDLYQADVLDELSLVDLLTSCRPDEVYNLAAPSFVPMSWRQPVLTAEFAAVGVTSMLEALRRVDDSIRFYQASSSEIFGEPREVPQNEETPLAPVTPYGVAKAYGHFITRSYRHHYGLHASSGILFNHESPRRPLDFVTRKVCHAAASISLGLQHELEIGNLDARRDWGFAGDHVRAMWLMLQQDEPDDYVIATGEPHSVRELVQCAFDRVGLDWQDYVRVDESLKRGKAELHDLVGDATRARERLGWSPSLDFEGLVHLLVDEDLARLRSRLEPAESLPDA